MTQQPSLKTFLLTTIALVAFAANSLLCRLALIEGDHTQGAIDPASFTAIRLSSGALALWALLQWRNRQRPNTTPSTQPVSTYLSALSLFVYAIGFSFAYVQLETGTGALILFGAVQLTMIVVAVVGGHKLKVGEIIGLLLAFLGFLYLVLPSLNTPSVTGFVLMTLSGIAWGAYTLQGSQSQDGLMDTSHNFTKTLPMVAVLSVAYVVMQPESIVITGYGLSLALMSGVLASGIGYAIWYAALSGLTAIQAAVVMLLVPVIAALAGILFVNETLSMRFIVATLGILGGIFMVIMAKRHASPSAINAND